MTTPKPATKTLDAQALRAQFPVLQQETDGKRLVYLDSGATSQKPLAVIEAMDEYYRKYNANVHRGVYRLSEDATARYEGARVKVQRFSNARSAKEIIFTANVTAALNLVAYSWGRANVGPDDTIVFTELEHHSNIVPWQLLAQMTGARLQFIHVTDDGYLDPADIERALEARPKLLAVSAVSNVLGTILPVKEFSARFQEVGSLVVVDAAQAVPHMPVDVRDWGADLVAFTGHKMLGPTGIGVLYGKRAVLEAMPPFLGGGDMIREVHLDSTRYNDLPWKFEAGTPNISGGVGLGAAVDYLSELGMDLVREHERELVTYAMDRLSEVPDLKVYGPPPEDHGAAVSFTLADIHPHDLAHILDQDNIAVRAGHHCAQPLMERYDIPATTRASFYIYNDRDDVDALVAALHGAREIFRL
ncbi:MAG: cysteine desulfurase [Chloroflexota bacterium]|nr:cysteine desulfurase [Chloroflexota bacterium]